MLPSHDTLFFCIRKSGRAADDGTVMTLDMNARSPEEFDLTGAGISAPKNHWGKHWNISSDFVSGVVLRKGNEDKTYVVGWVIPQRLEHGKYSNMIQEREVQSEHFIKAHLHSLPSTTRNRGSIHYPCRADRTSAQGVSSGARNLATPNHIFAKSTFKLSSEPTSSPAHADQGYRGVTISCLKL